MATLGVHNTDENTWKSDKGLLYSSLILNYNDYYLLNNLLLLTRGFHVCDTLLKRESH